MNPAVLIILTTTVTISATARLMQVGAPLEIIIAGPMACAALCFKLDSALHRWRAKRSR